MATEYDVIIRGGNLADGRGAPLREADVGVKGGRIAAIGRISGRGRQEIDARGKLVTPGFVDVHTHYDGQATWDDRLAPSSWHGVTTAVMGNCGVGFAPVRPDDRERLIELMEGVEDIPGVTLHEGLAWNWESFPEYLDVLASRARDIDICSQVPHAALRVFVMGERGLNLEPATQEDIAEMRRLTRDAVLAGAIGFSTSRTLNHRTLKGDPTPSLRATEAELMQIALGLRDAGSGVVEMISDFNTPDLETEFAMIRRIVEASGRPLSLSLGQRHSSPDEWKRILAAVDAAVADGLPICAQVAPRPIGVLMGLQASKNPFSELPSYRSLETQPFEHRLSAMRQADLRSTLIEEARAAAARGAGANFGMMFPLGSEPNYEPDISTSVHVEAERRGSDVFEFTYDLLTANDGKDFLFMPFANYARYNLDACGEMIAAQNTIMGLGDGGAHVGLISDASFTTYLLSHWGRDRAAGRFDISYLVKRQTWDTARAMGLLDRGVLAPGFKADINVIDFDALACERPQMAYDLPAGGKRLLQRARGYIHTFVSGVETYRNGEPTGALPGQLVRSTKRTSAQSEIKGGPVT